MRISGDIIIFGQGWSPNTYGELIGFDQSKLGGEEYIGKMVEVFGKKIGQGTSIEGGKKYYIKLLEWFPRLFRPENPVPRAFQPRSLYYG